MEGAGKGMSDMPSSLSEIINQSGKNALPTAVHRLDVPVTGCALFALTEDALVYLNKAFNNTPEQKIEKRYWAIIEKPENALPVAESGELVHWLSFDSAKNKSFAHNEAGQGRKKAVLRYRLAGVGTNYLFFEIELITGRHHQIRAQLARMGLRIKGDLKYGAKRSEKQGGIRLHARSLVFPNPMDGRIIKVLAAPPVMDNLWEAFLHAGK